MSALLIPHVRVATGNHNVFGKSQLLELALKCFWEIVEQLVPLVNRASQAAQNLQVVQELQVADGRRDLATQLVVR